MTAITAVANSGKRYEFYSAFLHVIAYGAFYLICWHVRFTPESGHVQRKSQCLLWANSRHVRCTAHVRFTPNSDFDCVERHVCFGPKADIAPVIRSALQRAPALLEGC